jgi:hypothetical protein
MREHQIVITLKPEQFLAIQKLARGANAKSMGAFVRQQLLAALGLEGNGQVVKNDINERDLEPVVTELRRLHGELKGFVAETLSQYVINEPGVEDDQQPVANPYIDDQYQIAKEPAAEPIDDQLEQVADRMFAISPRLGAIEPQEVIRDPLAELLGDDELTPPPPAHRQASPSAGAADEDDEDDEEEDYLLSNARALAQARAQATLAQQLAAEEEPEPERWPTREEIEQQRSAQLAAVEEDADSEEEAEEPMPEEEENINAAYRQAPQDPYGNSHGGAPFSGGPPPKRRKV